MSIALQARGIGIRFGGLMALAGVDFSVNTGEIFAIIGPNGAGKTTLFNIVSGLYRPTSGSVQLFGQDVTNLAAFRLARLGVSRSFQNLQIFYRMSVLENVMVGCNQSERTGLFADLLGLPTVRRQNRLTAARAMELLDLVRLSHRPHHPAAALAYGELKRLEIARALATGPRLLLLDEPAAGCNATETAELEALIRSVAGPDLTVVLIEHELGLVERLCSPVIVLAQGRVLMAGEMAECRADPEVRRAYLVG